MKTSDRTTARHAALRFVITSEFPSEHKATLIEVLTQALRDDEAAETQRVVDAQSHGEWQEDEVVQLKVFLRDRIARNWQHADECVMRLAAELHRDPKSVRDKATELGLGVAVDYRLARTFNLGREE